MAVYIGQTGDAKDRLAKHNKNKSFWERALVVTSKTNSLTQTHVLFLEWYCLQACRVAGRYGDKNGNSASKPHAPAPLEAECLEIFETAKILLATLGYPLFDPVVAPEKVADDDEVFYCKGTNGRGIYTPEGFVVLKGSIGRKEGYPSLEGTSGKALRERLLASGVTLAEGVTIVFQKDYLFPSPGIAALALKGRPCDGWKNWVNKAGKTLDEVKRQTGDS